MEWILIVVGAIVAGLLIGRRKRAGAAAFTIKREGDFYEMAHRFDTAIGRLEEIDYRIDKGVLQFRKIEYRSDYSNGYIGFRHNGIMGSYAFTASLTAQGSENGRYVYVFQLDSWNLHEGVFFDSTEANVLLTAVERAIISLDGNADVARIPRTIKSYSPFL
jgi:hypothetical protein